MNYRYLGPSPRDLDLSGLWYSLNIGIFYELPWDSNVKPALRYTVLPLCHLCPCAFS
jgi:hypothetical protein